MKDFFIADAAKFDNESVTSYFVLSTLQVREKKQGGQFLALVLADKTGTMEARMWDDFADALPSCAEGCYVKVQGQVSKYQGKHQITLQKMRFAAESEIDPGDYQPATQFDVDEMWAELRGYVSAFANEDLKRLVFAFLDDEEIGGAIMPGSAVCWSMC
jgi:3'-5' exoribonuclease